MKKYFALLLIVLSTLMVFSGCSLFQTEEHTAANVLSGAFFDYGSDKSKKHNYI